MNVRTTVLGSVVGLGLVAGGVIIAQPARNVSPARHPHIASAQRLTSQAYNQIVAAQEANEWDMNGHAQRARDLLDQANNELKAAAEAANRH
ncbi:MAG TPA: hypothetical protein VMB19_13515 [Silvibacterium sp.]|nr:hypothetical protein [Silvibacterium sp.]